MADHELPVTPVVVFGALFVAAAVLPLGHTPFERRVYGVGNGRAGHRIVRCVVGRTLIGVYMLSGLRSAIVGALLIGICG